MHVSGLDFSVPTYFAAQSGKNCFLLGGSNLCPAQNGLLVGAAAEYDNAQAFDKYVSERSNTNLNYIHSFQNDYFCPEYQGTGHQFRMTTYCSMIGSRPPPPITCSQPNSLPFIPLCKDTCQQSLNAFKNIFQNKCTIIQSTDALFARNQTFAYYQAFCDALTIANPAKGECLDGSKQPTENLNCGFGTVLEAREYCTANTGDKCCVAVDKTSQQDPLPSVTPDCLAKNECPGFSSNNKSNTPPAIFYALLVISILSLTGFIIFLLRYLANRKKAGPVNDIKKPTVEVISQYEPKMVDELHLETGDMILVLETFDDGWGQGKNLSTGLIGNFPLVCTKTIN
jgi:hypothetical protein